MRILGISGLSNSVHFKQQQFPDLDQRYYRICQGFNAAAALIIDNKIIACAAEERFNRKKGSGDFPQQAIRFCLQSAGLTIADINYIAHGFDYQPYQEIFQKRSSYHLSQFNQVYSRISQLNNISQYLDWSEGEHHRFIAVPHHQAHAASTFYLSGYPEALILVADGVGEKESLTISIGSGDGIEQIHCISDVDSIGLFYSVMTHYLGFEMNADEYKVMGLAAYGDPKRFFPVLSAMVELKEEGGFSIPMLVCNSNIYEQETFSGSLQYLIERLGPPRQPEDLITQRHQDVAAALQQILQRTLFHVLRYYRGKTQLKHLCIAGGVALNCKANQYIKQSGLFDRIFIQPAAGDDGTALGAALYTYKKYSKDKENFHPMSLPYYGPDVASMVGHDGFLEKYDVEFYSDFSKLCDQVARFIAQGAVVGWFQGRMEFGPRALGNRSIIADPRDPRMKDRLNVDIKRRESFRPFAPAVLAEFATKIFSIKESEIEDYQCMLLLADIHKAYHALLPAVAHVDGSARLQ